MTLLKRWREVNLAKASTGTPLKRMLIQQTEFVEHRIGDLYLRDTPREGETYLRDEDYVQVAGEHRIGDIMFPIYRIITSRLDLVFFSDLGTWTVAAKRLNGKEVSFSAPVYVLLERQTLPDSMQLDKLPPEYRFRPWVDVRDIAGLGDEVTFKVGGDHEFFAVMLDLTGCAS